MIDDVSYIESYIKQRLPTITVFQNSTGDSEIEIDVQNVPGQPLNLVRLLLSRQNVRAIRGDPGGISRRWPPGDRSLLPSPVTRQHRRTQGRPVTRRPTDEGAMDR